MVNATLQDLVQTTQNIQFITSTWDWWNRHFKDERSRKKTLQTNTQMNNLTILPNLILYFLVVMSLDLLSIQTCSYGFLYMRHHGINSHLFKEVCEIKNWELLIILWCLDWWISQWGGSIDELTNYMKS